MRLAEQFIRLMGLSGKHVGRIFWEEDLNSCIIVTSYLEDDKWFYRKYGIHDNTAVGKEYQSEKLLSYYIHNNLEEGL